MGGKASLIEFFIRISFAYSDVYRAVTHNKGIMNGIDALAIATGQDFRAIKATAHAYASRDGTYRSMTRWSKTSSGDLLGELELPIDGWDSWRCYKCPSNGYASVKTLAGVEI